MSKTLAEQARAARKAMGLTQKAMAEKAGVSPRAYQDFEGAKTKTQAGNLRQIIDALGLTPEDADLAQMTRDELPRETQVFLDMLGAYMESMTPDERMEFIRQETRRLFNGPR